MYSVVSVWFARCDALGPFHTGTQLFHFVARCSEKCNAEKLRSDVRTSNRTVLFQTMIRTKKVIRKVERYAIVPFPSKRTNRKHIHQRYFLSGGEY